MVAKSFKESNMKIDPVVACGIVTYARRRYRQGEEIVAVNLKERKQLLDTVLAVEPNSEQGKKLKAKYAEWLKTQPNSNEAEKKAAVAEEERAKRVAEEERKKAAEDKQAQRGRGQPSRQQEAREAREAPQQPVTRQAVNVAPPIMRPAVGGLPNTIPTDSAQGSAHGVSNNVADKKE